MNIIICDDEEFYLKSIMDKINAWAEQNGHCSDIVTYLFTSSEDLLDAWQHGLPVDALFLDIIIPGEMNGLSVAKEIHSYSEYTPIVFMTDYGEYALDGYKVNALRYLHKPVPAEAIYECMDIIWHSWTLQNKNCVLLDTPAQKLLLPANSIMYFEIKGHYCSIHTTSNIAREYSLRLPIQQIQQKLPQQLIVKCHRSYLVNLLYVRHIEKNCIIMSDKARIPISRSYQKEFMECFRQFYIKGYRQHDNANP